MAAAWDQIANEAYVFLNGQKVGTEAQESGSYLRDNSHTVYDIGLKRDGGETLKGYLRDLMIIGKAVTEEELVNITGKHCIQACVRNTSGSQNRTPAKCTVNEQRTDLLASEKIIMQYNATKCRKIKVRVYSKQRLDKFTIFARVSAN